MGNIFVKNLEDEVTEAQLGELFGKFGTITEGALALMSNEEGKSKGFAFINFGDMEAARVAVDEMNGFELNGKAMYVGRAQKKSERMAELKEKFDKIKQERINKYQGVNLYVKNLDETLEDAAFKEAFEVYGQITSCKIMRDDKGNAKGFGFVCYTTPEEATKAVTEMNGKILASKPIYVALAQRREQRRASSRRRWHSGCSSRACRVASSSLACLACTHLRAQLSSTRCRLAVVARCTTSLRWVVVCLSVASLKARVVSSSSLAKATQVATWSKVVLQGSGSLARTSASQARRVRQAQVARPRVAKVVPRVPLNRVAEANSRLNSSRLLATCLQHLHLHRSRLLLLLQQRHSRPTLLGSSQLCLQSSRR